MEWQAAVCFKNPQNMHSVIITSFNSSAAAGGGINWVDMVGILLGWNDNHLRSMAPDYFANNFTRALEPIMGLQQFQATWATLELIHWALGQLADPRPSLTGVTGPGTAPQCLENFSSKNGMALLLSTATSMDVPLVEGRV